MPTQKEKIIAKAMEILENSPNGIRYADLCRKIRDQLPGASEGTIHGALFSFKQSIDSGKINYVVRPERGLYILTKYSIEPKVEKGSEKEINEGEFYSSFAEYLVNDLEECSKAIPLGGNKFGDKWGTPDVLGIYKFSEADPVRPPIEIISAEIKIDTNQLVTAFGQACSYKLFSHKVYLVVPKETEKDVGRIESLCSRFGLGLILFDKNNPQSPNFEIRTRALKSEPDYFYVNEYLKRLGEDTKQLF